MFRSQSLDKLSSPDRLDQLLKVVRPQAWVVLLCTGLGLGWAVTWGFLGEVPVTVEGVAILVRPEMVVPVESTIDGRVRAIHFLQGDVVEVKREAGPGTRPVLIEVVDPTAESELHEEQAHLESLCKSHRALEAIEQPLFEERRTILGDDEVGQIARLDRRIETYQGLLALIQEQGEQLLEAEAQASSTATEETAAAGETQAPAVADEPEDTQGAETTESGATENVAEATDLGSQARSLKAEWKKHREALQPLIDQKIVSMEDALRLRGQILQLEVEAQSFALRSIELNTVQKNLLDWMATLEMRRSDLQAALNQIDLEEAERKHARTAEELDIQRRIDWLVSKQQLGLLRLPTRECATCEQQRWPERGAGRVVAVTTAEGDVVRAGDLLARVEMLDPCQPVQAIAFVPVDRGKKLDPGGDHEVRVSPTSVERERHGSLVGRVTSIPSDHPVTVDMAGHILGDRELAAKLLGDGIYVMVKVGLDREPACECPDPTPGHDCPGPRLRWSGPPPRQDPTVGTTCDVRITVETVRPIDLLFEFLGD